MPKEPPHGATGKSELLDSAAGQRVLVVDDEEAQRLLLSTMLQSLGYHTTVASSGEEAINLLRSHSYELMILDMAMPPGMNGIETYMQVLHVSPNQKAIMSSGLLEVEEVRRIQQLGISAVLTKPYKLSQLAQIIQVELAIEGAVG